MHRIEFFYDVVSPYAYVAFEVLNRYRARWELDLVWRPFFLGGVMKATGNQPPAYLPARGRYMALDITRCAADSGVPVCVPKHFPILTLQAMRLLTAIEMEIPAHLEAMSRRLWEAHFPEGRDISKATVLNEALLEAGFDEAEATRLLDRTADPVIKEALKATTQVAIDRGAYGAPTYFLMTADRPPEMFFGSDRLHHLAARIGHEWQGARPPT